MDKGIYDNLVDFFLFGGNPNEKLNYWTVAAVRYYYYSRFYTLVAVARAEWVPGFDWLPYLLLIGAKARMRNGGQRYPGEIKPIM